MNKHRRPSTPLDFLLWFVLLCLLPSAGVTLICFFGLRMIGL